MTIHLGDVPASSTLYIPFATYGKTNGESITLTGLAVTDIEIYKNGSTTQRSSDNGYTLLDTDGIDFDGITGIHGFSVSLSDNTDAGFYAAGSFYWVVVSSVTIDSQTVNFIAATFRIVAAENTSGTPVVDVGRINNVAATSVTTINANVGTTQPVNYTGTGASALAKCDVVDIAGAAVSTSTAQLGVNVVNNAGSAITSAAGIQEVKVASIAANAITATAINADAITAAKIADGAIDANTFAAGAITASAIAADAIGASELAADAATEIGTAVWATATRTLTANTNLNDLSAAGVRAAVGLASANLDTQIDALPTNAELTTALGTADDATLAAIAALSIPTAAQNRAEMDSNSTKLASIDGKTTNLPSDPADESLIIAATDAITSAVAALPTTTTVNAIKTKTDQLTFGVSNVVNANITFVNEVEVGGAGVNGNEWGPA